MVEQKQNVLTPETFVKESKCANLKSDYDWETQKNSVMDWGTFRQTFSNPIQFESD